jgi:hypothetical protein
MSYLSAIIYTSMILDFIKLVNGSSLSLPAHGWAGARATPFHAALFAKQKTKFGGGKARAGKNSFPPTPFFFARPSENYQSLRFPPRSGLCPSLRRTNFQVISKRANPFSPEGRKQSGNLSAEGGFCPKAITNLTK